MKTREERRATYKERTIKTGLGEIRVYFGQGRPPAECEFTFSNHTKEHTCYFNYKRQVRVEIKAREIGTNWSWEWSADRIVRLRFRDDKDVNLHTYYSCWGELTIDQALKIGEELAEFLIANTSNGSGK